jgi:Leucine-rich repeat (LRR) protein
VLGANLVRVDLSNNLLTKVPELQSKRLEVLWMKNNRVEVLDMLLMRYPLKQIRFAGNNLRVFYVGVLRKGVDNDLELMRFVDVAGINGERYATLEEIMDAAGNLMESQKMIKAAVDCEYPEMIKYLAKRK